MEIERFQNQIDHERVSKKDRVLLSGFQLSQILLFKDSDDIQNSNLLNPPAFGALKNILTKREMDFLSELSVKVGSLDTIRMYKGRGYASFFDGLIHAISTNMEAAHALRKISRIADLHVITAGDLSSQKRFKELPKIVQLILAETGTGTFRQIQNFLNPKEKGGQDGVLTILEFKKPSPDYLKAINDVKDADGTDLEIQEKITLAISDTSPELEKASHEFITPNFIPGKRTQAFPRHQNDFAHLTKDLNKKVDDDIENDMARLVLFKTLFSEEMESVMYSMLGMAAVAPFVLALNNVAGDNPLVRIAIKFIIPSISDFITFYGQLKPWLDGEALIKDLDQIVPNNLLYQKLRPFLEDHPGFGEIYDIQKRIKTSHKTSFLAGIGAQAIGTPAAEYIATNMNELAGAWIYSAIPAAVTGAVTLDTYRHVQKKERITSKQETLKKLFSNPAQIGTNVGAFFMFITGGIVFGNLHQFNNPFLLGLIEGMEEHMVATASTKTEINMFYGLKFNIWANRVIEHWIGKVGNEAFENGNDVK